MPLSKTKRLLFLSLCGFAFCARLLADDLPWTSDYAKALEDAKAGHKEVLLDFTASWCGPCRMMETTTFADRNVQAAMTPCILVKIDIDREPMIAAKYKVQAIPTCIRLNQFAEASARHTGYADAQAFSQWLKTGGESAVAKAKEPKSQEVERSIQALKAALESSDPAVRDRSMTDLFALCCRPNTDEKAADKSVEPEADEAGAKLAEAELKGFVERRPAWAARYLNDSRLGIRILVATLLAGKVGADFQFDPWAPAPERATAADSWARRLADR